MLPAVRLSMHPMMFRSVDLPLPGGTHEADPLSLADGEVDVHEGGDLGLLQLIMLCRIPYANQLQFVRHGENMRGDSAAQ